MLRKKILATILSLTLAMSFTAVPVMAEDGGQEGAEAVVETTVTTDVEAPSTTESTEPETSITESVEPETKTIEPEDAQSAAASENSAEPENAQGAATNESAADTNDSGAINFPLYSVAAQEFNAMVDKLPGVKQLKESDREAIEAARVAYDKLSDEDKNSGWVDKSYKTLCALEEAIEHLGEGEENPEEPGTQVHYTENIATVMKGEDFNAAIKKMINGAKAGTSSTDWYVGGFAFYSGGNKPEGINLDELTYVVVSDSTSENNPEVRAYWNPNTSDKGDDEIYVVSDGNIQLNADSSRMFEWFRAVKSYDFSQVDTSKVTDMHYFFLRNYGITDLDLSSFDTHNVTDMSFMFAYSAALKSLNVSSFNTSKVTNMASMFSDCNGLLELDLSSFDTSSVTAMNSMFLNCKALQKVNVSSFNTKNVTTMTQMFKCCDSLKAADLSSFNTSNVTGEGLVDMFSMTFKSNGTNPSKLETLDVSSFDTSKVTSMKNMFSCCSALKELDVSNFDTSNVTNMSGMFAYLSSITELDVSNFDTSKVTNMDSMFKYTSLLKSLDLHSFDTSNVTCMDSMFNGNYYSKSVLERIYVSDMFTTDNVTSSTYMFSNCPKIVGGSGTTSAKIKKFDKTYARIDTAETPGYFTKYDEQGFEITTEAPEKILATETGEIKPATNLIYNETGRKSVKESYTFASSDEKIATVDKDGVVTALAEGNVTITVTGEATEEVKEINIEVYQNDISGAEAEAIEAKTYSGSPIEPKASLTFGEGEDQGTLVEGTDYDLTYSDNTNVGTAKAVAEGKGKFKGTKEIEFAIEAKDIEGAVISDIEDQKYTTYEVTPEFTVTVDDIELKRDTDYDVSYSNNIEVGAAKITITAKGNYTGEIEKEFNIYMPESAVVTKVGDMYVVAEEELVLPKTDNGENGEEVTSWSATCGKYTKYFAAGDTVTAKDLELLADADNKINFVPHYSKSCISIEKKCAVTVSSVRWTGKALTPKITVKHGEGTLVKGEDYLVEISDNVNVGQGKVVVTGVGEYKGTIETTFDINKALQTISATASPKAVKYNKTKASAAGTVAVKGAKGKVTYAKTSGNKNITVNKTNGKVTVKKGTNAGTYTIKVKATAAETSNYASASKVATMKVVVKKANQALKVNTSQKTVKYNKKKAVITSKIAVKNAMGKVTYAKVSGNKNLTINKTNGKITVKKGTKKGTYTIKVKVSAAAAKNYLKAAKTVSVKVKVK